MKREGQYMINLLRLRRNSRKYQFAVKRSNEPIDDILSEEVADAIVKINIKKAKKDGKFIRDVAKPTNIG